MLKEIDIILLGFIPPGNVFVNNDENDLRTRSGNRAILPTPRVYRLPKIMAAVHYASSLKTRFAILDDRVLVTPVLVLFNGFSQSPRGGSHRIALNNIFRTLSDFSMLSYSSPASVTTSVRRSTPFRRYRSTRSPVANLKRTFSKRAKEKSP